MNRIISPKNAQKIMKSVFWASGIINSNYTSGYNWVYIIQGTSSGKSGIFIGRSH